MTSVNDGDGHDKLCRGNRKHGKGPCTRPAGWGTPHPGIGRCKLHGGSTPTHVEAASKEIAQRAVVTYGLPRKIDPRDALLEEVYRTAGAVAYLEQRIRELTPEALTWGVTEESDQQATEFPGTNVKREAKAHIWHTMFMQERKLSLEVYKAAIAAGIEERKVRLAESQGAQFAAGLRFMLNGLMLTAEQDALVPGLLGAMREQMVLVVEAPQ